MTTKLRGITEGDLELLMNWRMSESVTRFMNTNPRLTIESQRRWFNSLKKNDSTINWIIEIDSIPAGLINLADIDWENGTASWGYYIAEEKLRSLRLAISLEMSLYDYCFDILGFQEVHNEVFKVNEGVWKLHIGCGCRIAKEVSGEVEKEGISYDVIHLSIKREEWFSLRHKKNYEKIDFDIFQDRIVGMKMHHIGFAVADINRSIGSYGELGWKLDGDVVEDSERNINLAFLKRVDSNELLELVEPIGKKSPVSSTLDKMKNVSTPYHMCYEVYDLDKAVDILKHCNYIITDRPKPAIAFQNRRVAFMLSRDCGLIELLERKGIERTNQDR